MTTTQELIAELRKWSAPGTTNVGEIADTLERFFLESQRDAEAIRQLQAEVARLKGLVAEGVACVKEAKTVLELSDKQEVELRETVAAAKDAMKSSLEEMDALPSKHVSGGIVLARMTVEKALAKIDALSPSSNPENPC